MLERKKTLNVFKEARRAWGSFDDFPVGQVGLDPMPHLSRSRVAQPFYLVTALDEVLVQMAGRAELRFQDSDALPMCLEPGDVVYLPARVPSRIIPIGECIQIRLKGQPPLQEAVAWYCPACARLLHSQDFTAAIPQRHYWQAAQSFNANELLRTCSTCQAIHPPVDLTDIAWPQVAAALEAVQ